MAGEVWYAIYDKASGELFSQATTIAGKASMPDTLAYKRLDINPQAPAPGGGAYEWDPKRRDYKIVSLAEGLRRSAQAHRAEAQRLEDMAAIQDAAAKA